MNLKTTLLSIIATSTFACSQKPNTPQPIIIEGKQYSQEFIDNIHYYRDFCQQPYTKERIQEGDTLEKFGAKFCETYGEGQYINPCLDSDFTSITCQNLSDQVNYNNFVPGGMHCTIFLNKFIPNTEADYHGRCELTKEEKILYLTNKEVNKYLDDINVRTYHTIKPFQ